MKKMYMLVLFFGSLIFQLMSQREFAPIGSKWYYDENYEMAMSNFYRYESEKDTLVYGEECRLVRKYFTNSNIAEESMIIKQDGGKIYYHSMDKFNLLFDFESKLGDTVTFTFRCRLVDVVTDIMKDSLLSARYTISKVGERDIDGYKVKSVTANIVEDDIIEELDILSRSYTYYEVIGNDYELIPVYTTLPDVKYKSKLRCYHNDATSIVMPWWKLFDLPCDGFRPAYKQCLKVGSEWSLFYPSFVKSDMQGGDPMAALWDPFFIKVIEKYDDSYKLELFRFGDTHIEYQDAKEDPNTGRIWTITSYTGEEHLEMDLTLEVGDKYKDYVVDSVYIDSEGRKCISFEGIHFHSFGITSKLVFIEGIGPTCGIGLSYSVVICKHENSDLIYSIDDDSHFKDCAPVRVEQITENSNVRLYPNPAKNSFTFEVDRNDVIGEVKMFDITGKLVISIEPDDLEVDISKLQSGVYFVKAKINNKFITNKIVKL